jgi:hypothetical protein
MLGKSQYGCKAFGCLEEVFWIVIFWLPLFLASVKVFLLNLWDLRENAQYDHYKRHSAIRTIFSLFKSDITADSPSSPGWIEDCPRSGLQYLSTWSQCVGNKSHTCRSRYRNAAPLALPDVFGCQLKPSSPPRYLPFLSGQSNRIVHLEIHI